MTAAPNCLTPEPCQTAPQPTHPSAAAGPVGVRTGDTAGLCPDGI